MSVQVKQEQKENDNEADLYVEILVEKRDRSLEKCCVTQ